MRFQQALRTCERGAVPGLLLWELILRAEWGRPSTALLSLHWLPRFCSLQISSKLLSPPAVLRPKPSRCYRQGWD